MYHQSSSLGSDSWCFWAPTHVPPGGSCNESLAFSCHRKTADTSLHTHAHLVDTEKSKIRENHTKTMFDLCFNMFFIISRKNTMVLWSTHTFWYKGSAVIKEQWQVRKQCVCGFASWGGEQTFWNPTRGETRWSSIASPLQSGVDKCFAGAAGRVAETRLRNKCGSRLMGTQANACGLRWRHHTDSTLVVFVEAHGAFFESCS